MFACLGSVLKVRFVCYFTLKWLLNKNLDKNSATKNRKTKFFIIGNPYTSTKKIEDQAKADKRVNLTLPNLEFDMDYNQLTKNDVDIFVSGIPGGQ